MSHPPGEAAIHAEGLVKHFGDVKAVDGLDLTVPYGTVYGLLGPNGAGKTTTVRILATLLQGRLPVARWSRASTSRGTPDAVRREIGLTGQYAAVDEYLTGRENLDMIGRLYHLPKAYVKKRADELLERFSLTDAADRPAKTYSGGMRRRLDLAASLMGNPKILFLDEPTTGLDPRSRLQMWEVITDLVADGTTVLLTTQYLEEADQLAEQIVVIDQRPGDRQGHQRRAQDPGRRRPPRDRRLARHRVSMRPRGAAARGERRRRRGRRRHPHACARPCPAGRPCSSRPCAPSTRRAWRSTTSRCAVPRSTTCSSP